MKVTPITAILATTVLLSLSAAFGEPGKQKPKAGDTQKKPAAQAGTASVEHFKGMKQRIEQAKANGASPGQIREMLAQFKLRTAGDNSAEATPGGKKQPQSENKQRFEQAIKQRIEQAKANGASTGQIERMEGLFKKRMAVGQPNQGDAEKMNHGHEAFQALQKQMHAMQQRIETLEAQLQKLSAGQHGKSDATVEQKQVEAMKHRIQQARNKGATKGQIEQMEAQFKKHLSAGKQGHDHGDSIKAQIQTAEQKINQAKQSGAPAEQIKHMESQVQKLKSSQKGKREGSR